jgi:hypothetical protein
MRCLLSLLLRWLFDMLHLLQFDPRPRPSNGIWKYSHRSETAYKRNILQ